MKPTETRTRIARAKTARIGESDAPSQRSTIALGVHTNEAHRQYFRDLYHWFLDETERVLGRTNGELRRKARNLLLPGLNACQERVETGNFFDWVMAHRTREKTAGSMTEPPCGSEHLVEALRALLD